MRIDTQLRFSYWLWQWDEEPPRTGRQRLHSALRTSSRRLSFRVPSRRASKSKSCIPQHGKKQLGYLSLASLRFTGILELLSPDSQCHPQLYQEYLSHLRPPFLDSNFAALDVISVMQLGKALAILTLLLKFSISLFNTETGKGRDKGEEKRDQRCSHHVLWH